MREASKLINRARFLASGQGDPHSITITELCDALEAVVASYRAHLRLRGEKDPISIRWAEEAYAKTRKTFAKADRSPKGRDKGTLGSVHESGGPEGICPTSSSQQHQER